MTTATPGTGSGTKPGSSRHERARQKRIRLIMWVTGLAVLVVITAGAVWWLQRPGDPMVALKRHLERGDAYAQGGQTPEAIVEYLGAVQAVPLSTVARRKLADAYLKMNNLSAAYAQIIRIADLSPDDNEAQVKAGEMLLLAGKWEDARTRAETVLARD